VIQSIVKILSQFVDSAESYEVSPLGDGNINDTFLVKGEGGNIVLQCINPEVFPDPELVVDNFVRLSEHLKRRGREKEEHWQNVRSIPTLNGMSFFRDDKGKVWRAQKYLEKTITHSALVTPRQAWQVGRVLGYFHALVADMTIASFREALPGLHNLPAYLGKFHKIVSSHQRPVSIELSFCLDTVKRFQQRAEKLETLRKEGMLTVQVIHGDPKADNVLFREDTDEAVCLIDLDTVAVGPLHYDLGDCLRSCCNRSGERADEGEIVSFNLEMCENLLQGYFATAQSVITERDRLYIFEAVFTISFELGVRFLTDYLLGNRYFKVQYENENLDKAHRQFQLVEDIYLKEEQIRTIGMKSKNVTPSRSKVK
jgi:Ser/Thr protein kinase RdoA (MazF antagonist)